MRVESMSLVLRPRAMWEGADLGVRLLQAWPRSVYGCYLCTALPVFVMCLGTYQIAEWLPALLVWAAKPWLDRTILFALSRALFGTSTGIAALWAAQRQVWWSSVLASFSVRRLSASRSFTQPIVQLEGLRGRERSVRLRQLTARHRGVARLVTQAFAAAELASMLAMLSLLNWLVPHTRVADWLHPIGTGALESTLAYMASVAFVEPFYVAAGFGMYLNRRVELEAWDIEQEFRNAFTV